MRNLGLFAFGVTTCVLVPTALHVLQAGPKQVAKLVAPGASSLEIKGTKIDVSVDKAIVDAGSKVKVSLAANGKATVDVLVYESAGSGGGRVELPPVRVGYEEVSFKGEETKSLTFQLAGNRGEEMDGRNPFGHYTILVLPQGTANKLEALRHRAAKVDEPMNDPSGRYESFQQAYYQLKEGDTTDADHAIAKAGEVARLDVNTRPSDSPVSMTVEDNAKVGDDIIVKVKVKNPASKTIDKVEIKLAAETYGLSGEYKGVAPEQVEITGDDDNIALKAHETKTVIFHVKSNVGGTLGLYATARCAADNCYEIKNASDLNDGALDAVDIAPSDAKAPTVAVQQ